MKALRFRLLLGVGVFAIAVAPPPGRGEDTRVPATVTVDSTYPGYGTAVLTDGRWIGFGPASDGGGNNAGSLETRENTWVSGEKPVDHWIELRWPEAWPVDEVNIWWSTAEWYPRAFRIERWEEGKWVPAGADGGWMEVTDRHTVIPLPRGPTAAVRVFQPAAGACFRRFLAAQEVAVFDRGGKPGEFAGARRLPLAEFERLAAPPLRRNIARLSEDEPGASATRTWSSRGRPTEAPSLADGGGAGATVELTEGQAAGAEWPVDHSINGVSLTLSGAAVDPANFLLELSDGQSWFPMPFRTESKVDATGRRIEWSFEPTATRGARLRLRNGTARAAEFEADRYLPASHLEWPDRLVKSNAFQNEILALPGEPTYARVALGALSMRTARALIGIKDTTNESGVGWDGTIQDRGTLRFRIGAENFRLADFPDTTQRRLIDGWRPGVEVVSRVRDMEVRETAFAIPAGGDCAKPAVFVRISARNLTRRPMQTRVQASLTGDHSSLLRMEEGALARNGLAQLLTVSPRWTNDSPGAISVPLDLEPGGEGHADFVRPQVDATMGAGLADYRVLSYDGARAAFIRYWDETLASPAGIEVPEPCVNNLVKAVLAQAFIDGDGDVMPYGALPSGYEGGVFGLEETYPILGLALFGFDRDAERYTDGTLLRPDILKKTAEYTGGEDRHQQYRNGLEPSVVANLYRFSHDTNWARQRLPILKECAEWTMQQRRKTMVLENGARPLSWGLLPKWAYGGDIGGLVCFPFYPNYCCWRALEDTAWMLDELGDHATAKRYADDAVEYRAAIDRALEGSYVKDGQPPFVPLRVSGEKADEQLDFYQLFAGCLLDLEPFAAGSAHENWFTSFLEQDNRLFCFLPRYRPEGKGCLDALYGKGVYLTKLHDGAVREFLLSFYAYLAYNMERDTFATRESTAIYASDLQAQSMFGGLDTTDPLPCASAVALHLVRNMLVTEEHGEPGKYSGNLLLLAGAPSAWLEDGKRIRLRNMPTQFGPVSVEIHSHSRRGWIDVEIHPPARHTCRTMKLRLPDSSGNPINGVWVNGETWRDFTPAESLIRLPGDAASWHVKVEYSRAKK